jgi:hypothetical protein
MLLQTVFPVGLDQQMTSVEHNVARNSKTSGTSRERKSKDSSKPQVSASKSSIRFQTLFQHDILYKCGALLWAAWKL